MATKKEKTEKFLAGIITNEADEFKKVMELAIETGLDSPTIIDSEYGVKKLLYDMPFLGAFSLFSDKSMASQIILGITDDKDYAKNLAGALKNEDINIEDEGAGVIFMIKLFEVIGGVTEILDV